MTRDELLRLIEPLPLLTRREAQGHARARLTHGLESEGGGAEMNSTREAEAAAEGDDISAPGRTKGPACATPDTSRRRRPPRHE